MRRKLAVFFAGCALAACGEAPGEPRYALDDCRRVDLIDAQTGERIVGAEDLALDRRGGRLIISAYDRRAAEKAAKDSATPPPQGGVYAAPLDAAFEAQSTFAVESVIDPSLVENGLRPHGVDFQNGDIVFINRGYVRDGKRWRLTPTILRANADDGIVSTDAHCAANDVAALAGGELVTRDHDACSGLSLFFEDVFAQRKSGAYFLNGDAAASGLEFANGVAATPEGFAVAATREQAVYFFKGGEGGYSATKIALPGAPDNLFVRDDGAVIAAAHPSLMKLALNRKLGVGRAPSRIVSIDPQSGEIDLLFDDPEGAHFSAATIGIETTRGLVAGSVTDAGLLVCERAL